MQVAETIALLKATGTADIEVAVRVGLSLPTLKKYYFRELSQGAAMVRQAVIRAQLDAALKGKSSSATLVLRELDKGDLTDIAYRAPAGLAASPPKAAPALGKKDQRQAAAEQIGEGIFAPGEPPSGLTH
jgi:hypothetical protein